MIVLAGVALDLSSLAALGVLVGSVVAAYRGQRLLGPDRRRVIQEGAASERESWRLALDTALEHYEADNGRLRAQLDELEKRFEACASERGQLRARVERMLVRFAELGEPAPE